MKTLTPDEIRHKARNRPLTFRERWEIKLAQGNWRHKAGYLKLVQGKGKKEPELIREDGGFKRAKRLRAIARRKRKGLKTY